MRIALVAPSRTDPAHRRVTTCLARELRRLGDEVRVCASAQELERAWRRFKPDVCHVQFFSRGLAWPVEPPRGVRLIVTHQGASLSLLEDPRAFRRLCARAAAVTAVSRAGARQLRRAAYVPNGAEPPGSPRKVGRFALTVGRLAAYKGTDVLLMAAARTPGLRLIVCGPDQSAGRLPGFARRLGLDGRVRFTGPASASRVARLMRQCQFFVLPSRAENMPMALLEAMAAGKACVASRVGGVPELITHGREGLLVAPGDADGLARALETLAARPALRARLGKRARRKAARFTWAAAARAYRRLYR